MTGTAFGCMTAPTFPALSLTKGAGANHWDATGWRIKKSGSFGSITAKFKGGKLTGSGTAPPSCAPGVTYKINGTLRSGTLAGVATITLPSQTATTTFNAVKS